MRLRFCNCGLNRERRITSAAAQMNSCYEKSRRPWSRLLSVKSPCDAQPAKNKHQRRHRHKKKQSEYALSAFQQFLAHSSTSPSFHPELRKINKYNNWCNQGIYVEKMYWKQPLRPGDEKGIHEYPIGLNSTQPLFSATGGFLADRA
jgi:hypothetical protein